MEFTVLNADFEVVGMLDTFVSSIWTDRFDESGDFEICIPMDVSFLDVLKEDYYLETEDSDKTMIIADIDMTTDVEEGGRAIVTGRSLEQILDRRIVLNKTSFKVKYDTDGNATFPNLQNGIKQLLDENVINPAIAARRISNFIFEESTDPEVTKLTFEGQYYGNNLYDVISSLCKEKKIGFKVKKNALNQFVFKLHARVNRTYEQVDNPYVVFSPENDNLLSSSYFKSKSKYKNVAVVAGEVEEEAEYDSNGNVTVPEVRTVVTIGSGVDLNRREIFADASDISHNPDELTKLTDEQYRAHLKQRGIDTLIENLDIEAVEGEVEATLMYKYGEDFFIGDIVQIVDEYGHEGKAYISEFVISQDSSGISMYPTFMSIQEGEYDYE